MKRFLHLGCGPIILRSPSAEWVNVDISDQHNPDVVMDYLTMADHFGDDSFDGAISVHSLEHVTPWPEGVQQFFHQAKRVLKPGAILRLVLPDLKKVATKYVNGENLQDIFDGPYWTYKDLPATRFLFWARGWEHTFLPDEELIRDLAEDAGFTNFTKQPFQVSQNPELAGHDRFLVESSVWEMTA